MENFTMRNDGKIRVSTAIFALLVATPVGTYASDAPFECTTNGDGNWSIVATAPEVTTCPSGGTCTKITYTINMENNKPADHVVTLVEHDQIVETSQSSGVYPECVGDPVTELGRHDCSTQAIRLNDENDTGKFDLYVQGDQAVATDSTIVVKKGRIVEACRIASLGASCEPVCDPKSQTASKETFVFDDCEVEIALNPCTGDPLSATTVSGDCAVGAVSVDEIKIEINGVLQDVTVGEGWLSSGEDSCTTRWFRRRPYVTCSCTNLSDCFVKTSGGSCLCAGKGSCVGPFADLCNE
jgi:hypothetical protein